MSLGLRLLLTFFTSLCATAASSAYLIPVLKKEKMEQHVRDDGPQTHLSKEGTPTMGGIMILIGIAAALLYAVYSSSRETVAIIFLVVTTFAFALIGFLDDYIKLKKKRSLGLRAWQKIVLQLGVSFAVSCTAWYGLDLGTAIVPFTHTALELGGWYVPFSMFVLIAMVNSVNLTDGLDGLATGISIVDGSSFLAVLLLLYPAVLLAGDSLSGVDGVIGNTAVFTCGFVGACIGFLFFNRHPAKVFMGDTGAFALGGALSAISMVLAEQLLLPIMGVMFVLSSVSVIIQVTSFKTRHKRVFRMAPLHHHFEQKGVPETRVVRGYVVVSVVASVVAVLSATVI